MKSDPVDAAIEAMERDKRKTIFILIVPWDYSTADAFLFATRKEAEDYKAGDEVDEKARPYVTIREEKI